MRDASCATAVDSHTYAYCVAGERVGCQHVAWTGRSTGVTSCRAPRWRAFGVWPPRSREMHASCGSVGSGGGLASSTHAVDLISNGVPRQVVLKRYRPGGTDAASLEWERLRFAERIAVPSPTPLLVDEQGAWFGMPALVTDRLPGRPQVQPRELDGWLEDVANALATIHSTPSDDAAGALLRPHLADNWRPSEGLGGSSLFERAVEAVERLLPEAPRTRRACARR